MLRLPDIMSLFQTKLGVLCRMLIEVAAAIRTQQYYALSHLIHNPIQFFNECNLNSVF